MKIFLDNTQRVFLIQGQGLGTQPDIFCNLEHIPSVIHEVFIPEHEFKIYEWWNRKWKKCSRKHLNNMFSANGVNYKLK